MDTASVPSGAVSTKKPASVRITSEEEAQDAGVTAFCAKPLFMSDLKSVLLATNNLIEKEEETLIG